MINNVVLMGRLTATPELRTTNSGKFVTSFTVAVDRSYAPQGQERQTDFINCTAWNKTAEFLEKYFTKGQMIAVTGELQVDTYEKNGEKRYATKVNVNNVSFCGSKEPGEKQSSPAEFPVEDDWQGDEFSDDELPF